MKDVIEASPDLLQLAIAIPYPGTRFFNEAIEKGWLVSNSSKDYDVTGSTPISYPNYSNEEIKDTFYHCWRMWYKHIALKKPKTLYFFLSSEIKRNGYFNTFIKSYKYVEKIIFKKKYNVIPYENSVPNKLLKEAQAKVSRYN